MYSSNLRRASGGKFGANSIRVMMFAESPEGLWFPLMMFQAVLRFSPNAFACSSSARHPAWINAAFNSLILLA
jgi:hypothetical protein